MKNCIFCKICDGREAASVVYEDQHFIALMDAYPLTTGHCLVVYKQHTQRLESLPADMRVALFDIGHRINEAQKKAGWGAQGTNLLLNDGKAANQTVPHLHLHVIPRSRGDFLFSLPKLFLHISGVFGLKTSRKQLDRQAKEISRYMVSDD